MNKSKFTPGPWAWQKFGKEWCLAAQYGCRNIVLSVLEKGRGMRGHGAALAVRNDERCVLVPLDPEHPDARLIEAAPEMYAILETIGNIHPSNPLYGSSIGGAVLALLLRINKEG